MVECPQFNECPKIAILKDKDMMDFQFSASIKVVCDICRRERRDKLPSVLIVGAFDPIHEGHLDHIKKASELGDYLIILTHTDEVVKEKKGYCLQSLEVRMKVLIGILSSMATVSGEVDVCLEDDIEGHSYKDGIYKSLESYVPSVFAKGGDRTIQNMPSKEIEICEKLGIEIKYEIGDLLNSSSDLVKKAMDDLSSL